MTNHIYQRLGMREWGQPKTNKRSAETVRKHRLDEYEFLEYLNKPGKEENKGNEVEIGTPAGKAVDGSVHEEYPAFLGCSLVHGEDAGACQERGELAKLGWTFEMRKHFSETQSIFIHAHFLNDKSSAKGTQITCNILLLLVLGFW